MKSTDIRQPIAPIIDIKTINPSIEREKIGNVIPNSPTTHTLKGIFETAGTKRDLKVSKNAKMEAKKDLYGNATYNYESKGDTFEISISDYKKILTRQDKTTRKVFNFILEKYNQQKTDTIYFTLQEIIDRGMYKNKDTARRGIDKAISKLMLIHVKGATTKGKRTTSIQRCQLVMKSSVANDSYIEVEPALFNFLCQYYTMLPVWSDRLGSKAYSILDYIYYRARQELQSIKDTKSFNISLRTLNDHLAQPDPKDTVKHSQYIIDPLLEAIGEIELIQAEYKKNNNEVMTLNISPIYADNYSNANDFLNGYLNINLDEYTTNYLIELNRNFINKKEANIKRIEGLKEASKEK